MRSINLNLSLIYLLARSAVITGKRVAKRTAIGVLLRGGRARELGQVRDERRDRLDARVLARVRLWQRHRARERRLHLRHERALRLHRVRAHAHHEQQQTRRTRRPAIRLARRTRLRAPAINTNVLFYSM